MNIYISGISGTGMGPLALMTKNAGFTVSGSDLSEGAIYNELIQSEIDVSIGKQDGKFLSERIKEGVDWFVYTSALPKDHAELMLAKENNIKCSKRDEFTAFLIEELKLKMVAVAGTHGKTTTTAMIVFAALKLGLPVSYIVGTTLGFALSGSYKKEDQYFVYEADEYDRNFLRFHPWISVIPSVSYDHPDIYKTRAEYLEAFRQFESQSDIVIKTGTHENKFKLAGEIRRKDAGLALETIKRIAKDMKLEISEEDIIQALNEFPGAGRRFEKIADGVYSDYAHHPEEISATAEVAKEEAKICGKKGVVVIYQPHQNTRQHEVRKGYRKAFLGIDKIFWLPTYLTRENPELSIITPEEFIVDLDNSEVAEPEKIGKELADKIRDYLKNDYLVILMTAGPVDEWFRKEFGQKI